MAFSVNSFCNLCCQPVGKERRTRPLNIIKFPGCDGLPSVFSDRLAVYFIVTKLLELEDEQVLELMTSGDVDGSLGKDFSNRLCDKCEEVIIEALELHTKVVDLKWEIKKLGNRLKKLLKLSWQEGRDSAKFTNSFKDKEIAGKIRKFIDDEDVADKTNVKTENNPVKTELYDDERYSQEEDFVEDSFMDSFSNTQSDAENDRVLPNPDIDKEGEPFPAKRRRKGINLSDVESDVSSGDSDYKPEEKSAERKSFNMGRGSKRKLGKRKKGLSSLTRKQGTSSGGTCHICGMFQKTPNGFRNHMGIHKESTEVYGNKYDCPKCKYPTTSEFKLRYHLTKAHQETHNNTCSVCGFVGSRRHLYDKHMLDKHGIQVWTPIDEPKEKKPEVRRVLKRKLPPIKKENTCQICGVSLKTAHGLRNHMSVHEESTKKYENKYDCPKCKYPTTSEFKLRYHMTKAHQETRNNTCSVCGFVGSRRWIYDKHMLDKHGIQVWKPIDDPHEKKTEIPKPKTLGKMCNICGMLQKSPNGFINHMSLHEESTEVYGNKYDCPKCKYPCISEAKLRLHMTKAHNETNNNTCSICGYVGSRRHHYDKHMLDKHGIQVWTPIDGPMDDTNEKSSPPMLQCEHCTAFYQTSKAFERHQNTHKLSSELNNKFDCDICGFPTLSEKRLGYHKRRAHQPEFMYSCSTCKYGVRFIHRVQFAYMYTFVESHTHTDQFA